MRKLLVLFVLLFVLSSIAGFILSMDRNKPRAEPDRETIPPSELSEGSSPNQATEQLVPFHWSRLESTNYQEFASSLRAVQCPEPTITTIIRAELTRAYASQFAELAKAGNFSNLRTQTREKFLQRKQLEDQIDSTLYEQLKLQRPVRSANALFSAEQEDKILQARLQFPAVQIDATNPESVAQARSNRVARFQFLAQFLSSEQIQYYKLDREGGATRVQLLMQGMQPTKEEFLKVAEAVDGLDTSLANGWFKPEVAEALRAGLSPERFALLQDLRSPEYQAIFMVAGIYQFSPSTVNSLVSLRRNTYFQDPTGYLQQVKTLISQPQAAARYLGDKLIHPVVTK